MKYIVAIIMLLTMLPFGLAIEHNHSEDTHLEEDHLHENETHTEDEHAHEELTHDEQHELGVEHIHAQGVAHEEDLHAHEDHEDEHAGHAHADYSERGAVTPQVVGWTLGSVIVVSLISLIGVTILSIKQKTLRKWLTLLVALAAGTLLGDAFLHLIPHYAHDFGFTPLAGFLVIAGFLLMFFVERVIRWHHCHDPHLCEDKTCDKKHDSHIEAFGWSILFGDALHNLLDGAIIAASYLVSVPVGIATTIAIILHEIPQEIADFGVLLHAGFSRGKALLVNFGSGITAVIGGALVLLSEHVLESVQLFIIPVTAGAFVYIAAVDLLPELKGDNTTKQVLIHMVAFLVGIGLMAAILLIE